MKIEIKKTFKPQPLYHFTTDEPFLVPNPNRELTDRGEFYARA